MQDYPSCTNRFVKIGKSVASVNVFQRSSVLCHLEEVKDQAVAIKRVKIRGFCWVFSLCFAKDGNFCHFLYSENKTVTFLFLGFKFIL